MYKWDSNTCPYLTGTKSMEDKKTPPTNTSKPKIMVNVTFARIVFLSESTYLDK